MRGNGKETYQIVNPQGTVFFVSWTEKELAEHKQQGYRLAGGVETGKRTVNELHNKHFGEPVMICGCGHSLTSQKVKNILKSGILTIGVNECFRLLPDENFYPDYHLHNDWESNFALDNMFVFQDMEKHGKKVIVPDKTTKTVLKTLDCHVYGLSYGLEFLHPEDGEDYVWFNRGYSAIFTAIQFAVYIGCNPIFLMGVDLHLKNGYLHPFDTKKLAKKQIEKWEKDKWPAKVRLFGTNIPSVVKKMNRMIFNCSPDTNLVNFPYVKLEEVLQWMSL